MKYKASKGKAVVKKGGFAGPPKKGGKASLHAQVGPKNSPKGAPTPKSNPFHQPFFKKKSKRPGTGVGNPGIGGIGLRKKK